MHTANPFLLSVGIHLTLAALIIGALSVVYKTVPIAPEKIALKILMQPPMYEASVPMAQPKQQPLQKNIQSAPIPVVSRVMPQTKKPALEQTKPIATVPQQSIPVFTAPAVTSKIPDAIPATVPKASPPQPTKAENCEEENLGRIRTILMERLTYPKNALRLKQQGEAIVTFTLESNREVSHISISKSSDFELLDDAAKNLIIHSASEFPKPSKAVQISVPISYKLR